MARTRNREVLVNRYLHDRQDDDLVPDTNNNIEVAIHNPVGQLTVNHPENPGMETVALGLRALPPVSTFLAALQIFFYCSREYLHIKSEEDVHVSWKTVLKNGEYWRLFYAQYFHFSRVHLFLNVVATVSIGRYLEKKIQKFAVLLMIQIMGTTSNFLYILFNSFICSGVNNESTFGFTNVIFALRMTRIFLMDPRANNGHGEPTLIYGFFPVLLPDWLVPWHPLFETMMFEVLILDRCVVSNISGIFSALLFPHIMEHFHAWILIPPSPGPVTASVVEPPRLARSRLTLRGMNTRENLLEDNEEGNNNGQHTMEGEEQTDRPDPTDYDSDEDDDMANDNHPHGD